MLQQLIQRTFPLYRGLQQEAQKTTVKEDTVVFCCCHKDCIVYIRIVSTT